MTGSLRSRLVRLLDEGLLFSDSVIFSSGPVLAVVTVWYPEKDDPLRDVDDLADEVEGGCRATWAAKRSHAVGSPGPPAQRR